MGVPVKINQNGIIEIQKIELDKFEQNSLKISAQTIRINIQSV
jgi:malate/lactate dehydrogenase